MLKLLEQVDPYAWLVTLPLVAGMVWVKVQPSHHAIKQTWQALSQWEAMGLASLGMQLQDRSLRRASFWILITALGVASISSLLAYLGLFG